MYWFFELNVSRFHKALAKKEFTCEKLVKAYLQRVNAFDISEHGSCIKSIIAVNPDAITQAQKLDEIFSEKGLVGPLHGVPVLLKDNCETENMPTTAGSLCLKNFHTNHDAHIVKLLKNAGAIILAKTNLHEFAIWGETVSSVLGQTLNPYDLTRTPGGSSGGTGAAVAANFGMVGIGTDTVNSIRSPASACSLCGIRPTTGLISGDGIVPYSHTQDTAGPIARTVEDAVLVLDVLIDNYPSEAGYARPAAYMDYLKADGLKGKRLGVLTSFWGQGFDAETVKQTLAPAMETLKREGAELVEISENIDSTDIAKNISIHLFELKENLEAYLRSFGRAAPVSGLDDILNSGKYSPSIDENINIANKLSSNDPEYSKRMEKRDNLFALVESIFEKYRIDALVYPHQQQLVCKIGGSQEGRNGVLASVLGYPSIVVPGGYTQPDDDAFRGVPVGLEFVARAYYEPTLIEIAYAFEQATKFRCVPKDRTKDGHILLPVYSLDNLPKFYDD